MLQRTPAADLDYLAAIVDYTLFLQNSELRSMYEHNETAFFASTGQWESLPTINHIPLAELRRSRPYLDGLRKLGLTSEWCYMPTCLAALRNAQKSLPAGSSRYANVNAEAFRPQTDWLRRRSLMNLEVWPLVPAIRASGILTEHGRHVPSGAGKGTFRFELDLYNSTCYDGWSGCRLLCIQPGDPTSPLRLHLCASTLPAGVKYTAISYAWPAEMSKATVSMDCSNGRVDFLTSMHVEAVLKRLRLPNVDRYVWIDSVCINQANLQERSLQVAHMRQIYGRATSVFVWLGEVSAFQEVLGDPDAPIWEVTLRSKFEQEGDAVWWKRLWVLQETAIAARIEVGFGDHVVPWEQLMDGMKSLSLRASIQLGGFLDGQPALEASTLLRRTIAAAHRLQNIDKLRNDLKSSSGRFTGLRLHALLQLTNDSVSTLPQDRVYALLGLRTPHELPIAADYRLSANVLFLETLLHIIDSDHLLDILVDYWPRLSDMTISWSKDFTKSRRPRGSLLHLRYAAGSQHYPRYSLWRKDEVSAADERKQTSVTAWHSANTRAALRLELHLCGLRVDEIVRVPRVSSKSRLKHSSPLLAESDRACLKRVLMMLLTESMLPDEERSSQSRDLSLTLQNFATSASECESSLNAPGPECLFAAWWATVCSAEISEDLQAMLTSAAERIGREQAMRVEGIVAERAFVGTAHGLVALAPRRVNPGDLIITPFGSSTPFVLRPAGDAYTLLGDAYVHGIMHGEMLKLHEERPEDFKAETFILI